MTTLTPVATVKRTIPKSERTRHPHALIINLSGHRLPQSVFDGLLQEGHKTFDIFSQSIHIDVDGDIHQQCDTAIKELLENPNRRNVKLLELEGEIYYVGCGHAQVNVLIYQAIASLLGFNPPMIITGINRYKFQDYQCKALFDVQAWNGKWRSTERKKFLLNN